MFEKEGHGRARARELLSGAGYKAGGHFKGADRKAKMDRKIGKEIADAAVHRHESHMHPGAPKTKFKDGGLASGGTAGKRLDRSGRKGTTVNVIVAGDKPAAPPMMPPPPAAMARPPMPTPPAGGAPMPPPGMSGAKRGGKLALGGRAGAKMTAGAATGEGRLEKEAIQRKARGGRK